LETRRDRRGRSGVHGVSVAASPGTGGPTPGRRKFSRPRRRIVPAGAEVLDGARFPPPAGGVEARARSIAAKDAQRSGNVLTAETGCRSACRPGGEAHLRRHDRGPRRPAGVLVRAAGAHSASRPGEATPGFRGDRTPRPLESMAGVDQGSSWSSNSARGRSAGGFCAFREAMTTADSQGARSAEEPRRARPAAWTEGRGRPGASAAPARLIGSHRVLSGASRSVVAAPSSPRDGRARTSRSGSRDEAPAAASCTCAAVVACSAAA